jgi:hypothetical protein
METAASNTESAVAFPRANIFFKNGIVTMFGISLTTNWATPGTPALP